MHIFGRRRKESSQASSTNSPSKSAISVLSASLPRSYRQQNSSSNGLPAGSKGREADLPATPSPSSSKATEKENAAPAGKPRAHHATAPASGHGAHSHAGNTYINELGQLQHVRPPLDSTQPAFMVNSGGAGQQHHHTVNGATKQSLPPLPRDTSSKSDLHLKPLPNLKIANRRMSTGSIPSIEVMLSNNQIAETAELQVRRLCSVTSGVETADVDLLTHSSQLCYGYWPIETQLELNLIQIEEIVRLCGQEIRTRGS